MKLLCNLFLFCIFSSCGNEPDDEKNRYVKFRYDKFHHSLLVDILESSKYIKKIELDLQQDTLLINKVSKKRVPFSGEKSVRKMAYCTVKLPSNIKYVKLGETIYKLSEINEYSQEDLIKRGVSVLIVCPPRFPYEIY